MNPVDEIIIGFGILLVAFTTLYAIYAKLAKPHAKIADADANHCHIIITNRVLKHHEYLEKKPTIFNFEGIDYSWQPIHADSDIYILSTAGKQGNKETLRIDFSKQQNPSYETKLTV